MPSCCVPSCRKNIRQEGVRLFKLPRGANNMNRRELWITAIGKKDLHENSRICEVHFSPYQFERSRSDGRKLLKWNAVPDLLEPTTPQHMIMSDEVVKIIIDRDPHATDAENMIMSEEVVKIIIDRDSHTTDDENSNIEAHQVEQNNEDNSLSSNISPQEQLIANLRKSLRKALNDRNTYKRKCQQKITNLGKIFEKDQIQLIERGNAKGQQWSENTIKKSLELYLACGAEGYKEIRRQNLPYPSIRTIQHRLQCPKFKPGENV